jgi:hypothetical protein
MLKLGNTTGKMLSPLSRIYILAVMYVGPIQVANLELHVRHLNLQGRSCKNDGEIIALDYAGWSYNLVSQVLPHRPSVPPGGHSQSKITACAAFQ